jgi:DNA-directed RNA polymerase specialized sigma24 family protein
MPSRKNCRQTDQAWVRAWRRLVADPRTLLLAVLGTILLVLGVVLQVASLGTTLVVLGVAVITLGVLVPTISEAELGASGLKFKNVLLSMDETFRPFAVAQKDDLQRFALLMCGDRRQAAALTKRALSKTYTVWGDLPEEQRGFFALCTLVHLAIGTTYLHLEAKKAQATDHAAPARPQHEADEALNLLSHLSPSSRAAILLRHYQDLGEDEIAAILDRPVDLVRSNIHDAAAQLDRLMPPAGMLSL